MENKGSVSYLTTMWPTISIILNEFYFRAIQLQFLLQIMKTKKPSYTQL